ncbi:X8 domain-containing protein [Artemisia annua]|uniref:X8 domain-containing protein n=1 Tax=Artemisia annua TaxID=35608 RepID=A0A2U1N315_ARTAN|nr:X8 domain-containing protein [Artemisia annua]
MAKVNYPLCFIGFFLFVIVCSNHVEGTMWCVAKSQASDSKLQEVLDFLCAQLDCKEILPGGSCFDPDTHQSHASYAIDLNYRINGLCDDSYATFALTDPCNYRNMYLPMSDPKRFGLSLKIIDMHTVKRSMSLTTRGAGQLFPSITQLQFKHPVRLYHNNITKILRSNNPIFFAGVDKPITFTVLPTVPFSPIPSFASPSIIDTGYKM